MIHLRSLAFKAPRVSIFNQNFWKCLTDELDERFLGVAPAKERAANAFPIVNKINGRHRVIRAGRFFRYYGILMPRTTACKAELDDEGLLVLDLRATRAVRK